MSLFGGLLGELDDDPFFGGQMRRMNSMMNSFFRDPFGGAGGLMLPYPGGGGGHPSTGGEVAQRMMGGGGGFGGFPPMMMPPMMMGGGLGNMLQLMGNSPGCHSYSSSTVMTMTPGPDGRPQVYQASQSVKQGPGGVKETKKTVADSRTGVKKMAIGHHLQDRAHIIEREQNVYSGDQEERQDFINLDEDEAESFNREWERKATEVLGGGRRQLGYSSAAAVGGGGGSRRHRADHQQLALPPPPSSTNHNRRRSSSSYRPSRSYVSNVKPSTALLLAKDAEVEETSSEDEEEDVEEVADEGEMRGKLSAGGKRKLSSETLSSDEETDGPKAKKYSKSQQDTKSKSKKQLKQTKSSK